MNNSNKSTTIEDKAWVLFDSQTGKIIDISYEETCPGRFQVLSNTGLQRVKEFPKDFQPGLTVEDLEEAFIKQKKIWQFMLEK